MKSINRKTQNPDLLKWYRPAKISHTIQLVFGLLSTTFKYTSFYFLSESCRGRREKNYRISISMCTHFGKWR